MPPEKHCECCERDLPSVEVPFTHQFRDSRPDMDYCRDCDNAGCDLETCSLSPTLRSLSDYWVARTQRIERERRAEEVTPEEMAEVYRSLGVEPTPDPQWNQDQEDST